MNSIKNKFYLLLVVLAMVGCEKETNDDTSFLQSGTAPKDFAIAVAVTPAGMATITPTATGVASFSVYFGDATPNPVTVTLGNNATHGYTDGTYIIKVVAKNLTGDSATLTKSITVSTSQLLVDFEAAATTYPGNGFGGAAFAKVANPYSSGINTSANVGKITKGATGALSEVWAGITINTSTPFTFSSQGKMKMKVYANHVGAIYKFKLENPSTGATVETDVVTTVANAWEELTFTMDPSVIGRSFGGFSIFYEFGLQGNGSANFIGLFDDVKVFP